MPSPTPAEIRAWARDHGFAMPDRGPLSAEVKNAYAKAHRVRATSSKSTSPSPSTTPAPVVRRVVDVEPVVRPAVPKAPLAVVEDHDALAGSVADLSKRVRELEQQIADMRAGQLRSARRFGRRSA